MKPKFAPSIIQSTKTNFMQKAVTISLLAIIILIISCSKKDAVPVSSTPSAAVTCDGVNAKFAADVSTIIKNSCATGSGCHGAGSNNGPGVLENFTQIKNAGTSIKNAVVSGRMPRGGSLTAAQKKSISCWVDGGTLNN
jgi:hypothetical protein